MHPTPLIISTPHPLSLVLINQNKNDAPSLGLFLVDSHSLPHTHTPKIEMHKHPPKKIISFSSLHRELPPSISLLLIFKYLNIITKIKSPSYSLLIGGSNCG